MSPRTGTHLHDLLGPWVPHQRWYPAKGREARTRQVGRLLLPQPEPAAAAAAPEPGAGEGGPVQVVVHVLRVEGAGEGDPVDLVQVPLVHRREPLAGERAEAALLGVLTEPGGEPWWVYDGPHDPAFTAALLGLLDGSVRAVGLADDGRRDEAAGTAAGHRAPGRPPAAPDSPARVLRGGQSNTSGVVEAADAGGARRPVIVKLFRTLHPGRNPDVEVQAALSGAGVRAVPALSGWVEGTWPTGEVAEEGAVLVHGDLAVASEFLEGAQDAWREATAAVAAGEDFSARAAALGEATASVHAALAVELPSREATPTDAVVLAAGLRARLEWALGAAPVLAGRAEALRALVARLRSLDASDLPRLQRVHGDYHLGQVLDVPDRGWVLLDFEGEPLRPLAERTLPDLALRDVAGMLRSFDYAARQGAAAGADPEAAHAWARAARDAFCEGYARASGEDPRARGELLGALELDKALYEVVYEVRNRPDWVPVPLEALDRLLAG